MSEKTKVVMIQDTTGQTRRVRIDGHEVSVLIAAPIPGAGMMNFTLTLSDVEVGFEAEAPAGAGVGSEA
ncbi:hypothetical protein MPOCJGCO_4555 [Methylobacterium trifolii]|uniref:Uncharacterized protein n=1 Tax=Methylobacterium trifolii TaxID=1003092 RepID=A0ABQ4U7N5_9HYPH|nr:hypothetical protein MPOCJGCO_4555 [Methylobacterium trifolii]